MQFKIIFIGYLAIALLQAKPLDSVSRLLQIALTKQPGYVKIKSILSTPAIRNIILRHQISSSLIKSLDLSTFGFDKATQKWLKTALKSFTTTNINN